MKNLSRVIEEYIDSGLLENIAIRIGRYDNVINDIFYGNVDENTLFDMASITKIMVTTTLALIAIDKGLLNINDNVSKFFKTDKPLTIKHLLTHTMGIGHKPLNLVGYTYDNIAEKILEISDDIEIGSDVIYSCPGFILLGKILEKIYGKRLDECFYELVQKPLELINSVFLPQDKSMIVNANLKEEDRGYVNDYNCRYLGGVCGNAGLFSNIVDVNKFVLFLLDRGKKLFSEETFVSSVSNYTEGMSESRGLGFLYVDEKYCQTGGLFNDGTIGHCGHTGQSMFVDYKSGLYVIVLTDATISIIKKYGKDYYDMVMDMRHNLHKAIKEDLGL